MDNSPPITPEIRENLVAYLDGELDEVATIEVERSLSESAEIRREVEALSRTWDLLEELPTVQSSSEFTERTMASLQTATAAEVTQPLFSPTLKRNLFWGSLVAGVAVCAAVGFLIANRLPRQSDPLVQDLPVIQKLDLYEEVGDVRFLEELDQLDPLIVEKPSEFQNDNN